MKRQIIVDCERMRYPYTGLYHFCKELGQGLVFNGMTPEQLSFYTPVQYLGFFGTAYQYLHFKPTDRFFNQRLSNCNLWHCTNQASNYVPSKTKGLRILSTIHDLNFLHDGKNTHKQKHYLKKIQRLVDKSDHLVAISNFVKGEVEQNLNLRGKKVTVISNGGANPPAVFKQPKGDFSKPFFLTVGTIAPKKNFHVLAALLKNNDCELIIAGINQNEQYRRDIVEAARKLGVERRVRLLGPVSEEEKYWLINQCILFCFPSIAEGHGLPVVEAMQLGKQVLLSKHTSLPEIGGPYALYLDSFDPDYLSAVADQYLENLKENSKANQLLIDWSKKFDWKETTKKYKELYASILETH